MPNGKSLYSTFAAAGKAEGVEEAAGINVQALKDTIRSETEKLEWQQQKREEKIDLFSTALDTASTLYEGHLAQQEFGTYQKGVQSQIAKKSYTGEDYESFIGTAEGKKYIESFAPEKSWTFKGGTQYKFGEGEGAYKMGREDIMHAGEASKYGVKTDFSMYKEAVGADVKEKPLEKLVKKEESSLEKRLREDKAALGGKDESPIALYLGGKGGEDYTDEEWSERKQGEKVLLDRLDQGPGAAGDKEQEVVSEHAVSADYVGGAGSTGGIPGVTGGRAGVSKSNYLDYFSSIGKNIYSIFYGERGAKQ